MLNQLGTTQFSADIFEKANIGLWAYELDEGQPPRMYHDETMLKLVGLDHQLPPEEAYHAWYDHIDKDSYGLVHDAVDKMIAGEYAEVQHPWHYPDGHTIIVRCGGIRNFSYTKGIRIEGTHQDVSATLHYYDDAEEKRRRATAAKDKILSEITQVLYGYNLTVNLKTLKYSVITGTGMAAACEIFKSSNDYEQAIHLKREFVVPKDRDRISALMEPDALMRLVSEGKDGPVGTVVYEANVNGERQWHETNVFVGTDANGDPIANILGRNITEQHNEQERREREARAVAAKDQILSGITQSLYGYNITVNLDTLACSIIRGTGMDCIVNALENIRDFDTLTAEFLKRIPAEHQTNALHLMAVDEMRKLAKQGISGFAGNVEYILHCPCDGPKWHEVNLFLGTDENGHPIANILARDVTEQHVRQERQEREREAAAAKDRILSEITQALYGYNLTVNLRTLKYSVISGTGMEAACEVFKSSDDYAEAIRLKLEFVAPGDRERIAKLMEPEALKKVATEGSSRALATAVYEANVNGEHQWHETNIFIGTDTNGDPIANILGRNITVQRTRAEAETQLRAAQAANKAKSEFLFNMSHDIRTPMNAIIGFTDKALKHKTEPQVFEESLEKVKSSSEYLLRLVNDVLDMAKIESGKLELHDELHFCNKGSSTLLEVLGSEAARKGIEFHTAYDVQDRYFWLDENRANQIVANLISNSIKYTDANGDIWYSVKQLPCDRPGYGKYIVSVEDTGKGMSPEFLKKVFEAFERDISAIKSGAQGTGLGMAIVKKLVDAMGGTISIQSELGKGTKVSITNEHRLATPEEIMAYQTAGKDIAEEEIDYAGKRVLLVEDNELNREIAVEILSDEGLIVDEAEDGSQAVELLRKKGPGSYDFILMDIQMPILNGYEATRAIREMYPDAKLPIIALSANAFAEDKQKSLEAGMNDHVAKPIKIKELFAALAKFL